MAKAATEEREFKTKAARRRAEARLNLLKGELIDLANGFNGSNGYLTLSPEHAEAYEELHSGAEMEDIGANAVRVPAPEFCHNMLGDEGFLDPADAGVLNDVVEDEDDVEARPRTTKASRRKVRKSGRTPKPVHADTDTGEDNPTENRIPTGE
jgi:hypothetical protein